MLADLLRHTEVRCLEALRLPVISKALSRLEEQGVSREARAQSLRLYWKQARYPETTAGAIQQLRQELGEPEQFWLERAMLVDACAASLPKLRDLPVSPAVCEFMCQEFQAYAQPPEGWLGHFNPESYSYRAYCAQALLERFVAGQLSWEMAGIPRSWLPKMPLRDLGRVLRMIGIELHGFAPMVATHLTVRRVGLIVQLEKEWMKSYYRVAKSIQLQPEIKGLATVSWLFCEETARVTPHLAWTRKFFLENGAVLADLGKADPNTGFLTGSSVRQKLYAEGKYQPQETAVIWPRAAMLRWADSFPDPDDLSQRAEAVPARRPV